MSLWSKLRGTIELYWQLGLGGPQLKNNSGVIEHRNAADNAFAISRGLDPVGVSDYTTKNYTDTTVSAKPSVVLVGLANVASLSGTAVVLDGVTANTVGMRVLLTAQSTASQNGFWLVQSGAWTRPSDFATGADASGALTMVTGGNTKSATIWSCTTAAGSAVIDTNSLAFSQVGGAGGFFNGGESFGANRTLGNNDAYSLGFETNNVVRLSISATGAITVTAGGAAVLPLAIQAAASQTEDLQQWKNSAGTELSCITSAGWFNIAGAAAPFPNSPLFVSYAGGNTYLQLAHQNLSAGISASTDIVAVADTGTDSTNYLDLGINSSTYADTSYTGQAALDSYVYAYGGHMLFGTATATKVLKFFTAGAMLANLRMQITDTAIVVNTLPIQGVTDPTSAQDAATKAYVDAAMATNPECVVATTASITLSGTQTIDGVAVVAGNRVLVKNQATGSQNGIYVVAAGAWSRATDMNTSAKANAGIIVAVRSGTANANTVWTLTTQPSITLGTTSLTFSLLGGLLSSNTPGALGTGAGAAGTSDQVSRDDHTHQVNTAIAGSVNIGDFAAIGTSASLARADHVHAVTGGTPVAIGAANSAGTATTFARSDHVHQGIELGGLMTCPYAACTLTTIDVWTNSATWGGLVIPSFAMVINSMIVSVYQSASGNVWGGIYNANTNALLATTGTVSVSTTGFKTMTFSSGQSLTAGTPYYLCVACTANGARFVGTASATSFNLSIKNCVIQNSSQFPSTLTPAANPNLIWIQALP